MRVVLPPKTSAWKPDVSAVSSVDAPIAAPPRSPRRARASVIRHLVFLALAAIGLYFVWPSLWDVFAAWPRLGTIQPIWFAGVRP